MSSVLPLHFMQLVRWLIVLVTALSPAVAFAQQPARPPLGDFEPRLALLFEAIQHDDPARAVEVFFPRDAFLQVKAMQNPGRYYDKLRARFEQDIHALHAKLGDLSQASYDHLELSRRGGLVKPGEEGNKLPYWAARHSFIVYRQGKQKKKLELRVAITWEERWYVIHLSEFR